MMAGEAGAEVGSKWYRGKLKNVLHMEPFLCIGSIWKLYFKKFHSECKLDKLLHMEPFLFIGSTWKLYFQKFHSEFSSILNLCHEKFHMEPFTNNRFYMEPLLTVF